MPKGRPPVLQSVVWRIRLPDCSCKQLLLRDRRRDLEEIPTARLASLILKVNKATELFVSQSLQNPALSSSELSARIDKATSASRMLLNSIKSGQKARIVSGRRKFLRQVSASALSLQGRKFLFDALRLKGARLDLLESEIATFSLEDLKREGSPPKPLSLGLKSLGEAKTNIKDLARFKNPYLPAFVGTLAEIWIEVTGRKPKPTTFSKSTDEKMYLFADWVREIIVAVNRALDADRLSRSVLAKETGFRTPLQTRTVALPKEGTIYDIIRRLPKT